MKKIGFTASSEDTEQEDRELSMLKEMINKRYSPVGRRNQRCYKTSREIVYELREMTTTTIRNVSMAMRSANYQLKIIGDLPHWQVYDTTITET